MSSIFSSLYKFAKCTKVQIIQFFIFIGGGGGGRGKVRIYTPELYYQHQKKSSLLLLLIIVIAFQKVHDSQFLAKCTQKRNKLCSFSKKKSWNNMPRTSLTFPETIYTPEAQKYTKSALKSGALGPV